MAKNSAAVIPNMGLAQTGAGKRDNRRRRCGGERERKGVCHRGEQESQSVCLSCLSVCLSARTPPLRNYYYSLLITICREKSSSSGTLFALEDMTANVITFSQRREVTKYEYLVVFVLTSVAFVHKHLDFSSPYIRKKGVGGCFFAPWNLFLCLIINCYEWN